ncbi:helix-turn-helix transcriptional regulator [Crassaminicella profunda]|uniref:helix-turn-helix transcriptional regulator n=1 Tax=Crassaminicella profunda TaxID=1286698 RepID=UPI001CA735DD|nr:helix-turn-helix transcriptional regulator [Crassaminicella profunda]QZY53869.1 helix-turn-helix transcriptional regulator [Crassaminicella profunda]
MNENFTVKNVDDFYDFFVKVCKFGSEKVGMYIRYYVNPEFGEGVIEQIRFRNGMELCITDLHLKKSIGFEYDLSNPPCEMNYMVDGNLFNNEEQAGDMNLSGGNMSIYFREKMRGIVKFIEGRKINYITIIANEKFINENLLNRESQKSLIDFRKSYRAIDLTKPHKPKVEIKYIFKQMLACDFSDIGKMMYLQSKAIEVLSLVWEKEIKLEKEKENLLFLDKQACEAIEKARQIVEENIVEPYTISMLAKEVHLNEYKLKKGFKQLYNMTIFAYLKHIRMLKAKELLSQRDLNIGQVACAIGYTNASYFARNFKEIYGENPKDFQFGA